MSALTATVALLLPLFISGEVTLRHGSIEVKVPHNFTKAQASSALLEAFSAQESALANTVVNEVSTHQWSLMAEEFGEPKSKGSGEAPKIEAWYINEGKEVDRARCMEKQLHNSGFAPLRFEAVGHSNEDLEDCLAKGVEDKDFEQLSAHERKRELRNWCSHLHLFNALGSAEGAGDVDYFLVVEDSAAVHDKNLKPMVENLIKDLSDPNIAKFANVKSFDFVQLDPYGGIGFPVGFYQGRPLYQPSADKVGASNGAYQGSHALLVKRSAVTKILDFMSNSKATRMELVSQKMPEFIAVGAGAAVHPNSPFYLDSTASRACKTAEHKDGDELFELGPDAKKAWWFPKQEPKKSEVKHEKEEEKPEVVRKETKSFLR